MSPQDIFTIIVNLVAHWYKAECGPHSRTLKIDEESFTFYSHRNLTPKLQEFYNRISGDRLTEMLSPYATDTPSLTDMIQEILILRWLNTKSQSIDWTRLLRYMKSLESRTYENNPVTVNLVFTQETGTGDVTEPQYQKFLDQVAASPLTYFEVDSSLQYVNYKQISWSQVKDPTSYNFYPSFLHPFNCILKEGQVSVHLTRSRDILIMDNYGLIASRRKGHWRIYDVNTFKNSLVDIMGDYYVGANIFEILFDLSFRRHGALLIYDPEHKVLSNIVNEESILSSTSISKSAHSLIGPAIHGVGLGSDLGAAISSGRRLVEIASNDGAVVFDTENILAVGSIVKSHPEVGSHLGARTTAAHSAYYWGGIPAKVSSDGDVTLYFNSKNQDEDKSCLACLEFL